MNELLRKRIERHLENLPDEQGYALLDYVEFLEARHGTGTRQPTAFERVSEGVEDVLRAGRLPAAAVRGTMRAVDSASRLMQRLAEAGRSAVDELSRPPRPGPSPGPAPGDGATPAESSGEPQAPGEAEPPGEGSKSA
jgi:hypothetical protein